MSFPVLLQGYVSAKPNTFKPCFLRVVGTQLHVHNDERGAAVHVIDLRTATVTDNSDHKRNCICVVPPFGGVMTFFPRNEADHVEWKKAMATARTQEFVPDTPHDGGYLYVHSKTLLTSRKWTLQWAVLTPGELSFYARTEQSRGDLVNRVNVRASICQSSPSDRPFSFEILGGGTSRKRLLLAAASSADVLNMWVHAINYVAHGGDLPVPPAPIVSALGAYPGPAPVPVVEANQQARDISETLAQHHLLKPASPVSRPVDSMSTQTSPRGLQSSSPRGGVSFGVGMDSTAIQTSPLVSHQRTPHTLSSQSMASPRSAVNTKVATKTPVKWQRVQAPDESGVMREFVAAMYPVSPGANNTMDAPPNVLVSVPNVSPPRTLVITPPPPLRRGDLDPLHSLSPSVVQELQDALIEMSHEDAQFGDNHNSEATRARHNARVAASRAAIAAAAATGVSPPMRSSRHHGRHGITAGHTTEAIHPPSLSPSPPPIVGTYVGSPVNPARHHTRPLSSREEEYFRDRPSNNVSRSRASYDYEYENTAENARGGEDVYRDPHGADANLVSRLLEKMDDIRQRRGEARDGDGGRHGLNEGLPPGWRVISGVDGRPVYYDSETMRSTSVRPSLYRDDGGDGGRGRGHGGGRGRSTARNRSRSYNDYDVYDNDYYSSDEDRRDQVRTPRTPRTPRHLSPHTPRSMSRSRDARDVYRGDDNDSDWSDDEPARAGWDRGPSPNRGRNRERGTRRGTSRGGDDMATDTNAAAMAAAAALTAATAEYTAQQKRDAAATVQPVHQTHQVGGVVYVPVDATTGTPLSQSKQGGVSYSTAPRPPPREGSSVIVPGASPPPPTRYATSVARLYPRDDYDDGIGGDDARPNSAFTGAGRSIVPPAVKPMLQGGRAGTVGASPWRVIQSVGMKEPIIYNAETMQVFPSLADTVRRGDNRISPSVSGLLNSFDKGASNNYGLGTGPGFDGPPQDVIDAYHNAGGTRLDPTLTTTGASRSMQGSPQKIVLAPAPPAPDLSAEPTRVHWGDTDRWGGDGGAGGESTRRVELPASTNLDVLASDTPSKRVSFPVNEFPVPPQPPPKPQSRGLNAPAQYIGDAAASDTGANVWKPMSSRRSGKKYYFNEETGETAWTMPPGAILDFDGADSDEATTNVQTPAAVSNRGGDNDNDDRYGDGDGDGDGEVWVRMKSRKSGKIYYYNEATAECVWSTPENARIVDPDSGNDVSVDGSGAASYSEATGSVGVGGGDGGSDDRDLVSRAGDSSIGDDDSEHVDDENVWVSKKSRHSKRTYFYNTSTGETLWELPAGATLDPGVVGTSLDVVSEEEEYQYNEEEEDNEGDDGGGDGGEYDDDGGGGGGGGDANNHDQHDDEDAARILEYNRSRRRR